LGLFFVVAEIGSVRLKRCALAKILRLNFTKIDTSARNCKGGEECHDTHKGRHMSRFPCNAFRLFSWI